jgi:hypothetical protein
MSYAISDVILESNINDSTWFKVLVALAYRANDKGNCFPSVDVIVRDSRTCARSVRKAIADMEKEGLISTWQAPGRRRYIKLHLEAIRDFGRDIGDYTNMAPDWVKEEVQGDPCQKRHAPLSKKTHTPVKNVPKPLQKSTGEQVIEQVKEQVKEQESTAKAVDSAEPPADPETAKRKTIASRCPHEKIVMIYSEVLPELPKVLLVNDKRQKAMRTIWRREALDKTNKVDTEEDVLKCFRIGFELFRKYDWGMGRVKDSAGNPKFIADFDFVLRKIGDPAFLERAVHQA